MLFSIKINLRCSVVGVLGGGVNGWKVGGEVDGWRNAPAIRINKPKAHDLEVNSTFPTSNALI
jgi:hypothetical protein